MDSTAKLSHGVAEEENERRGAVPDAVTSRSNRSLFFYCSGSHIRLKCGFQQSVDGLPLAIHEVQMARSMALGGMGILPVS